MTTTSRNRNTDDTSTESKEPVNERRGVPPGKPDTDNGEDKTGPPPDQPRPESLPRGTTKDQVNEMESEGQAEKPGQDGKS